jgi:putative endonuclease
LKNDGAQAEKLAADFLQRNGLRLIESNFRCRMGEIDLILKDGATLVFAEVRLRSNERFGGAAASITAAKQARITCAAQIYLQQNHTDAPCRFDAVLLDSLDAGRIEWIKNAFEGA